MENLSSYSRIATGLLVIATLRWHLYFPFLRIINKLEEIYPYKMYE